MRNDIIFKMNTEILPEKQRKRWTAVFVAFMTAVAVVCISIMNIHFDELARYPYKDEHSRQLIREYLNDEEIDYIIDYSIPPNMFIAFIREPGFTIYHASEYKQLSNDLYNETPAHIVKMVEETRNIMSVDELAYWIGTVGYSYEDLYDNLINFDGYDHYAMIDNVHQTYAYVDHDYSISTYTPNVIPLSTTIPSSGGVRTSEIVQQPLADMLQAMAQDLSLKDDSAGIVVEKGYVSYEQQKKIYEDSTDHIDENGIEILMPGHDEHQLGLAVDLSIKGLDQKYFEKTQQYDWLKENAWKYGFTETYTQQSQSLTLHSPEPWHWRYIGEETARMLHEKGETFAQYGHDNNWHVNG